MQAFELDDLIAQRAAAERPYLEFLRHPSLSAGLYVLPAGSVDSQQPHAEDEVYYVISGRGTIMVAGKQRPVSAGSVIYVGANVEHRFHTIVEDLVTLVFFAPAESG